MTLSEFMQTEVGQRVGGTALANVDLLVQTGMDREKAATIAFGGAIVTDENGQMVRAEHREPTVMSPQLAESKKK